MSTSAAVKRRLEAQGFYLPNDAMLDELAPWLRWSPVLCAAFMILGVTLQSPAILWALALTAFAGMLLPFHPFDLVYNYGFRYVTGTQPLPNQGPQRRFACGIATAWLLATGWAFQANATVLGYALGVPLILVAALVSVTHICIPSIIYNAAFDRRARSQLPQ